MRMSMITLCLACVVVGCVTQPVDTDSFQVTTITESLSSPWGMDFLDETTLIVTQKSGVLSFVDLQSGAITDIRGVPQVVSSGQGGLLDVALVDNWVYLTYSASYDGGVTTHLARARLVDTHLEELEVLYRASPALSGGAHFGSRVLVVDDYVFLSTGDRGEKNFGPDHVSQDTSNTLGSIIRMYRNGSIPQDNPFVGNPDVVDSIYTFGHRNVQGMTLHPDTQEIWISDHGEQDGDEISVLEAGGNYGWPIVHYGCTYVLGRPIGGFAHERDDIVNPVFYWECGSGGFPPAGMTFYSGDVFPHWQGDLFVGGLAKRYLAHFSVENGVVSENEPLLADRGWRIRDVMQGPEGYMYVLTDGGGLYRLSP